MPKECFLRACHFQLLAYRTQPNVNIPKIRSFHLYKIDIIHSDLGKHETHFDLSKVRNMVESEEESSCNMLLLGS